MVRGCCGCNSPFFCAIFDGAGGAEMLVMPSFIAAVGGVDAVYFSFDAQHVTFFANDKKMLYFSS
ncbi:MAG TPA: hypothetical protein DHV89_13705 [Ruminococcus sp.]|nr:hypothetical protein [Ruminococcus sp.]